MAFSLKSRAFEDGDEIPRQFTADGDDVSPDLLWSDPPSKARSFALTVLDRNAKSQNIHWALWNLPGAVRTLAQGVPNIAVLPNGTRQGQNNFKKIGYSGPSLAQVTEHNYEFTLYALDSSLGLKEGSSHAELVVFMGGHVNLGGHILEQTQLSGRFKPRRDDARLRSLESDQEYIHRRDDVKRGLEQAYKKSSRDVTAFFKRFSLPSSFAMEEIGEMLKNVSDVAVRRSLEDYVAFANRFRVMFHLKTNPLRFKTLVLNPHGEKFHVKIIGDHLEPPITPKRALNDDSSHRDFFESENLKILGEAQNLIDKGKATFTQIEDGPGYSILKDFEVFAYKDDGVAFFVHNAEQAYLGCIFGEKITKQLLHDMGKTVTQFQKEHFFRTAGGRPPDIERLKKALEIDKKPISNKAKAAELAGDVDQKKVKTQEVKLSKMKRDKRKKKHQ